LLAELRRQASKQRAGHLAIQAQRKDPAMAVHAAFNVARRRLTDVAQYKSV